MATSNPASWFNPSTDRVEAGGIGVVFSRLSTAQRTGLSLATADAGLFTYDTQLNQLFNWNGSFSAQMAALNSSGGLNLVSPVVVATGIITTNNPGFQLTEQWNNAGVTFIGWFTNTTDTSSAVGSLFADFQLNSVSAFSLRKDGIITVWGGVSSSASFTITSTTGSVTIGSETATSNVLRCGGNNRFVWNNAIFGTVSDGTGDLGATASSRFNNAFFKNVVTVGSTTLLTTSVALTDVSGVGAGTITNAPSAGNPTKWISIVDNGTTRKIPTWT